MARVFGVIFTVIIGVLTTNVLGLKFKKQEGYTYKPIVRSSVELDIQLSINDKFKAETALFLNKERKQLRPYVVQTTPDTDYCFIIYHNKTITKEQRPACTDKTPVDFKQYPAEVKAKCEGKKQAYVLREHQCKEDGATRTGGKSLQKRNCGNIYVFYNYFINFDYAIGTVEYDDYYYYENTGYILDILEDLIAEGYYDIVCVYYN